MEIKSCLDEIKLKNYEIEFQKMLIDILFEFMNINPESFDETVNSLLEKIGEFFNVDRTYLFTMNNNNMTYSHEWCNDGINSEVGRMEEVAIETFPWWLDQLDKNNLVNIEDVNMMPLEASSEQEQLFRHGVKSLISVPIITDKKIHGFIGIDSVISNKKWTEENIELLYFMAKILSSGIVHINNHEKIECMAYHDLLTGLPNRSALSSHVKEGLLLANCKEHSVSIMLINLDGFKRINDTLGHDQGDELLIQVSRRLSGLRNKKDKVYHLGGDEFILYLRDYKDEENLDNIASKIIAVFKKAFTLREQEYYITGSIGISKYPTDGDDVEMLIKNADMAMNKAKSLGKNQYLKCTSDLKNSTLETISLTNSLYKAIEQNEMMLYYQPKVNGLTGEIVGVEALLRWNHPELGFIPPFKFIPLAEKTRLILPIGSWVFKTVCKQAKKWQEKGYKPIKIAVNFSIYQLNNPSIIEQIRTILEETSLEGKYLEIEITESVAADTNGNIKETLDKIKEMGITLAIDDFGKEYSSLSRLKELPIDRVKIDMSFIQGIGKCYRDETIVKSVISLASNFGYESVAEGVETKEQLEFLNKNKCDQLQGYYFYKPMPVDKMEKLLMKISNNISPALSSMRNVYFDLEEIERI